MRIADVLHHHGRVIHKIRTTDTVEKAVRALAAHNIGALLVTDRWGRHVGIFSERDLVPGWRSTATPCPTCRSAR
jgi:predicted transcriptional regulator